MRTVFDIRKQSIEAEAKMRRNDEAWVMPIRPVNKRVQTAGEE
jgi:hypothetical protein